MNRSSERNGDQKSLVFGPVHARFVPPDPRHPAAIHRDRSVGLKFRTRGQRLHRRELPVLIRAELDIVIPLIVSVPGDVSSSIRSRRHGRLPIIGGGFADPDFAGPLSIRERAQKNITLSIPATLPHPEYLAVPRRLRPQESIRSDRRQAVCPL